MRRRRRVMGRREVVLVLVPMGMGMGIMVVRGWLLMTLGWMLMLVLMVQVLWRRRRVLLSMRIDYYLVMKSTMKIPM